jgi:hypothetical protein
LIERIPTLNEVQRTVSLHGLIVAGQYGDELPAFADIGAAEVALSAQRETGLQELRKVEALTANLDYSTESLKTIERWFFENGQPVSTSDGYSMPHAIGFYFGEVLCRVGGFDWVIQEFPFLKGRYEIGVQRGLLTIMLTKGRTPQAAGNQKMASLWRECRKYAVPD